MPSVADALREETRRRIAALSPEARIQLALELGDADIVALCEARSLGVAAAKAAVAKSRRAGRVASPAHDG